MKSFSRIALTLIIGSLPLLAGCTTTSDASKKNSVTIKKGNFESADAGLGNDIKSILAQGGLNTTDPGSTVQTAQAENGVKTLSTTATDLQSLVAQLDAGNNTAVAQTTTQAKSATTATAAQTTALALAEQPKPNKAQTKIAETVQTTTYAPIGAPASELIPITMPVVETPNVTSKAVASRDSKPAAKSKRLVTPQVETSYKKPTVKRF
jgi:hypothetical protein|nr:hypothetical protein [Neorhizobium tomejilense]